MMFPTVDRNNDGKAGTGMNLAAVSLTPRITNYHGDNQAGWSGYYSNYFGRHRLWPANTSIEQLNSVYIGRR
jgi:hypothetical protein